MIYVYTFYLYMFSNAMQDLVYHVSRGAEGVDVKDGVVESM